VAFADLPAAVQSTWRQETGLEATDLIGIHIMDEGSTRSWEMGMLYHGLLALQGISERPVYRAALREMGEVNNWSLGRRFYHADDHCVGYLYLAFAAEEKNPLLRADVQARFDWILKHQSTQLLAIGHGQDRWTWSDALFMAPPVWLKLSLATGDRAYLEFMDREWWATVSVLFASEEGLFYRDASFFARREKNGREVFWSRGNGWVLASLALMLEDLPQDFPARAKYENLFKLLAARVATLQPEDALWRSSLLDTVSNPHPEASSTALFCYAFARGARLGLLDAEYASRAARAWIALQKYVRADGHLGGVQQPGAGPGLADMNSTAPYGVGAFLMAGAEIYQLSLLAEGNAGDLPQRVRRSGSPVCAVSREAEPLSRAR
jgi:rhamnogalacturonyl hydrolase YesR